MQIGTQLQLLLDIGLDQGFPEGISVVLGLAHEGLGDGGDQRIDLHRSVGIDVGQFQTIDPQDIHPLTIAFDIAGNVPGDHSAAIPAHRGPAGNPGQIVDQIVGLVICGIDGVGKLFLLHIQLHHDILFLIQVNCSKAGHTITCIPIRLFFILSQIRKKDRGKPCLFYVTDQKIPEWT